MTTIAAPRFPYPPRVEGTSFRIPVPGDHAVRLVPVHEGCVPAPEGGTALVETPRRGLVLRLVKR